MASKKVSKGKRYTEEEKQRIVGFVNQVNAEKGRGGVAAAVKKFGASALTVNAWLKAGKADNGRKTGAKIPSKGNGKSKVLEQLVALDREIGAKRKELAALEVKFEKLKARI